MSATDSSSDRYSCNHCGEYAPSHSFYDAAMCSESCRREADAETLLNKLKHDHTVCSTCYRCLKIIEKPPSRAPDHAIGFQHRTENATWGEKRLDTGPERDRRLPPKDRQLYAYEVQDETSGEIREYQPGRKYDWASEPDETPVANEPIRQGTVCQSCGNSEHNVPDVDLRSRCCSTMLVGHHFTERVRELETSIDEVRFWDVYTKAGNTIQDAVEAAVIL